jgi:hypothetical protein
MLFEDLASTPATYTLVRLWLSVKPLLARSKRVLSLFSSIAVIKYQLQTLGVFLKNSRLL